MYTLEMVPYSPQNDGMKQRCKRQVPTNRCTGGHLIQSPLALAPCSTLFLLLSHAFGACLVNDSDRGFRNWTRERESSLGTALSTVTPLFERGLHLSSSRWFYQTCPALIGHLPRTARAKALPGPISITAFRDYRVLTPSADGTKLRDYRVLTPSADGTKSSPKSYVSLLLNLHISKTNVRNFGSDINMQTVIQFYVRIDAIGGCCFRQHIQSNHTVSHILYPCLHRRGIKLLCLPEYET